MSTEAERKAGAMGQMAHHIAALLPNNHEDAWAVLRMVARHVACFPYVAPDGEPNLLEGPHHADVLSFMRFRRPKGGGIDYWTVEPSGDYIEECEAGLVLAEEYLAFVGKYPTACHASLLNWIVGGMVNKVVSRGPDPQAGDYRLSGVEGQFLRRVNEYAVALASAEHGRSPAND